VKIDDMIHAAHRLLWSMVYGEWPECVRRRNRDDPDNRLVNLYAASCEIMMQGRTQQGQVGDIRHGFAISSRSPVDPLPCFGGAE